MRKIIVFANFTLITANAYSFTIFFIQVNYYYYNIFLKSKHLE